MDEMITVERAYSLLGKKVAASVQWEDEPPCTIEGRVVGLVLPAPDTRIQLQLLMHSGGEERPEGWEFELFADTIRRIVEVV